MELVATLLTTSAGMGAGILLHRVKRARRRRASAVVHLDAALEPPLETGHLSPKLADLATGARLARQMLETPLRRFDVVLDYADYDLALCEARYALWQWLRTIGSLDASDFALLRRLGLDPRPLRALVYETGVLERCSDVFTHPWLTAGPDPRVAEELHRAMEMLRRFEFGLVACRSTPYR